MRKLFILSMFFILTSCSFQITTTNESLITNLITSTDSLTTIDTKETIMPTTNYQIEKIKLQNTTTLKAKELFENADVLENLHYTENSIKLVNPSLDGVYISKAMDIDPFMELVLTWNARIDEFSKITFFISIGDEANFSDFFIMGYWTENYKSSFKNQEDDFGKVLIDVLKPKFETSQIKFKILIKSDINNNTSIKNISLTTKTSKRSVSINNYQFNESYIDVLAFQQLSIPVFGNRICSPTSLSMVLNYYNHIVSPSETAGKTYDQGAAIYGNWSFNASYAGGFDDLQSRVEYIDDLNILNNYLVNGIPLILSIRTTDKSDLENSIMAYPSGHLVVLIGLSFSDGVWYAIVNDPAEYTDEAVTRQYLLSELIDAWSGYTYVIQTN